VLTGTWDTFCLNPAGERFGDFLKTTDYAGDVALLLGEHGNVITPAIARRIEYRDGRVREARSRRPQPLDRRKGGGERVVERVP